jgi:hypothetical protein
MRSSWARITSATVIAAAVTAGAAVGTGTAVGTAQPIVIGSCDTTVRGTPGTPVELSPSAVTGVIDNAIDALPLGGLLLGPVKSAAAALPAIPIGALPTGTATISGAQLGDDVVAQLRNVNLPLVGGLLTTLLTNVRSALASGCSVILTGVNAAAAPVQQGATAIAQGSQQLQQQTGLVPRSGSTPGGGGTPAAAGGPGGGGAPTRQGSPSGGSGGGPPASNSPVLGGLPSGLGDLTSTFGPGALLDYGLAESPLARYAGIPFDPAPGVKYGGDVPGYAPTYGQLGQGNGTPPDGVQTAGQAVAYDPGGGLGNGMGLPMLLAVLALAGVTAALVRTWVSRRMRTA